jgi:hypothetical protein
MEMYLSEKSAVQVSHEVADVSLFSIGAVLSLTWKTFSKNLVVFLGLAVLIFALELVAEYGIYAQMPGISQGYLGFLQILTAMVVYQWLGGAAAYGVYQALKGNKAYLGESLLRGTARLVPLILLGIISSLGVFLGFILLVIPGVILMCIWAVDVPACVVERLGANESLLRSGKLTEGCRLKIFGLFSIVTIASTAVTITVTFLMPSAVAGSGILSYIPRLADLPIVAFSLVMYSVIYYELRRVKEGATIDTLANVFD